MNLLTFLIGALKLFMYAVAGLLRKYAGFFVGGQGCTAELQGPRDEPSQLDLAGGERGAGMELASCKRGTGMELAGGKRGAGMELAGCRHGTVELAWSWRVQSVELALV